MMVAQENSETAPQSKLRIAWVETNREADDAAYFMETYLRNRHYEARVFTDVAKAKEWLLDHDD